MHLEKIICMLWPCGHCIVVENGGVDQEGKIQAAHKLWQLLKIVPAMPPKHSCTKSGACVQKGTTYSFLQPNSKVLVTIIFASLTHFVEKPSGSRYDLPVEGLEICTQVAHFMPIQRTKSPSTSPRRTDTKCVLSW